MSNCENDHGDPCPSVNNNMGTHDQVKIAMQWYTMKCEYQQQYMTKYEYQHWDKWPSVDINMGIYERVCLLTLRHMTKCDYRRG